LIKYATEPLLIVEVLSESTAKTDRSAKLNEYRLIPSLQYYLIVDQESCFVEIYIREGKRWYVELYDKMEDIIALPYFGIEIPAKDDLQKDRFLTSYFLLNFKHKYLLSSSITIIPFTSRLNATTLPSCDHTRLVGAGFVGLVSVLSLSA
jgi:hypothetical protein